MTERPHIVFVDDDPRILNGLRRDLRGNCPRWRTDFIDCPRAALAAAETDQVDLAVLDLQMPKMNGIELARAIGAVDPEAVCLMLTGAADLQVAMDAVNTAGVFRFYTKPCDTNVLIQGIEDGLEYRKRRIAATDGTARPTPQGDIGLRALEKLPIAVLVLDAAAKLIFANPQGAALLAARDGLSLSSNGTCRAATSSDTKSLTQCIADVLAETGNEAANSMLPLERPSMRRPLSAMVTRIGNGAGSEAPSGASVALFLTDPEHPTRPPIDALRRLFDLTGSEAKLAQQLVDGARIETAAERIGVTVSSARTYLKQIFAKTGTNRQADLIRLVLSSSALFAPAAAADGDTEQSATEE